MSDKLTIGSLFSGYAGLDEAVERMFDAEVAWVSEIEPGPCKILEAAYPGVPNLGDIVALDWRAVPRVNILTGGSPCQDISSAGRQAGMVEGTRSNLWAQMRLGIQTLRPDYVVWENVLGALSTKAESELETQINEHFERVQDGSVDPDSDLGSRIRLLDRRAAEEVPAKEDRPLRALGRVLGDLSELGYDAEWEVVSAAEAGAPHRRKRVFVLAWPSV